MFNSEPQTYVLTSETLQIFVLLSGLCKIPFVRKLFLLKKASIEKGQKRAAIFSEQCARTICIPTPCYVMVINCYLKAIKPSF